MTCRLDRRFAPMASSLLAFARRFGPYRITSGCRTHAKQRQLYDAYLRGESEFPVAVPGTSAHEKGLAVDIARTDIDPYLDLTLHAIGASWRQADPSLRWSEKDPIHFEWRPG